MKKNNIKTILTSGALAFALAGCGASPNAALPSGSNVAVVSSNVLQFVAGTANLYGLSTGLNVVATYRQPAGALLPGGKLPKVDYKEVLKPEEFEVFSRLREWRRVQLSMSPMKCRR